MGRVKTAPANKRDPAEIAATNTPHHSVVATAMGNPSRRGSARGGGGGESEIHAAARSGDLRAVESICNSNPLAINSRDRHSRTPYPPVRSFPFTFFESFILSYKLIQGARE